jgi:hypothetical protein
MRKSRLRSEENKHHQLFYTPPAVVSARGFWPVRLEHQNMQRLSFVYFEELPQLRDVAQCA